MRPWVDQSNVAHHRNLRSQPGVRRREEHGRLSEPSLFTFIILFFAFLVHSSRRIYSKMYILHIKQSLDTKSCKSVHIWSVTKTVCHDLILLFTKVKRHMLEKHSHIGYCRTDTRCWHHHTITVQGIIRNDDQSLSPVTPLVSLLFLSFLIP